MPFARSKTYRWKRTVRLNPKPYRKAGTRKALIEVLDVLTSKIVRKETPYCVTCGTTENLTCSHYFKRSYLIIRFDLRNCNPQCADENLIHNTNPFPYRAFMVEKYGEEVIEELHALRMGRTVPTDDELRQLIKDYKERLKR